jgi:hypothetical protein
MMHLAFQLQFDDELSYVRIEGRPNVGPSDSCVSADD